MRGVAASAACAYAAHRPRARRPDLRRFASLRRVWGLLLLAAVLGGALLARWDAPPGRALPRVVTPDDLAAPNPPGRLARCRAVDGDTLRCGAERVRVVGLDTPELQGRCAAETRLAERAKARLAALVAEGVSLQPQGRDRYDRLLAVVRDRAGRDLAAVLIREGHARPYLGGQRAGWC